MAVVELSVNAWCFAIVERKVEERRSLVLCVLKSLLNIVAGVIPPLVLLRTTLVLNPSRPPLTPEFQPG